MLNPAVLQFAAADVGVHIDNRDVQRNSAPSSIRQVEPGDVDPSRDAACEKVDAVHRHMQCVLLTANAIACATATGSARPPGCDSVGIAALSATTERLLPKFEEDVQHPGNIATAAGLCKSTVRVLCRGGEGVPSEATTASLLTADIRGVLDEAAVGEIIALADKRGTRGLLPLAQEEMDRLIAVSKCRKLTPAEAATLEGSRDVAALLSQFQRYAFACGDAQRSAFDFYGLEDNKLARRALAGLLLAVFPPPSGVPAAAWVDPEDVTATHKPGGEPVMASFFIALLKRCQEADEARWNHLYTYGYLFCGAYTSAAKGGACGSLVKLQLGLIGAIADAHEWTPSTELVGLLPAAMRRLRPLAPLGPFSAAAGTGIAAMPADAPLRLKLLRGSTAAALGLPQDPARAPCDLDLPATAFNALSILDACAAGTSWHTRTQKDVLLPAPTGGQRMGERAKELKCTLRDLVGHDKPEDCTAPIEAQRLHALGRSLQLRPLDKVENPYKPHAALVANKGDEGHKAVTCKRLAQQARWLSKIGEIPPEIDEPATTAPVGARGIARPARQATARKAIARPTRSACSVVLPEPDAPLAAPHATSGVTVSSPCAATSGPAAAKRPRVETAAEPCPATAVSSTARGETAYAVSAATAVPPTAVAAAAEASASAASSPPVAMLQGSAMPRALPPLPQGLTMQCEAGARQHVSVAHMILFRQLWREGADDPSISVDEDEDDDCDDDEACGPAMGVFMHAFGAAGPGVEVVSPSAPGMHSAAIVLAE